MDWDAAATDLGEILSRFYPALVARAWSDGAADLGRAIPWDASAADAITADIGSRAAGITATLQDRVAVLVSAYQDDYVGLQAALQVEGFGAAQARTTAYTEGAWAYNRGMAAASRSAGLGYVWVDDGDQDAGCADVAGSVQTVEWADANPLQHPNCTRRFSVYEGTPGDRVEEDA